MKIGILNGDKIKNRDALHDALAAELDFPDWYGRNLDALYDSLTDIQEDTELLLLHWDWKALKEHLGSYAESLEMVLIMAAGDNPRFRWKIIWEDVG